MEYIVYVLKSATSGKFYIGQTKNLERRLHEHNSGQSKSTKSGIPWELFWHKTYQTRSEAVQMERFLKQIRNREYLQKYLKQQDSS